jgi:hypothetical protein
MTNGTAPKTYRGSRVAGVVALLTGAFLAAWWGGVLAVGVADVTSGRAVPLGDVWAILTLVVAVLLSGLAVWGGATILLKRVVVDEGGLTASCWPFGFSFAWDAVEAWSVVFTEPGETRAYRAVRFRVRGFRWPAIVDEGEVCRPGFEEFLEDVRARTHEAGCRPARPAL